MLLPRFALHAPRTVGEAVDLLARHGEEATVYAGGTELLLAMKLRVLRYGHLIDVKRIPGLAEIAVRDGALALGALATHYALERHPLVARHLPAYAALSRAVANVRVRVADGRTLPFARLVPKPGRRWCGWVDAFKKAGWCRCWAVGLWRKPQAEPWLLLTNWPGAPGQWYGWRMWEELAFRDFKSTGWQWQRSRRTDPRRVARHWLVLAVATLWTAAVGTRVEDAAAQGLPPPNLDAPPWTVRPAGPPRRFSLIARGRPWLRRLLHGGQLWARLWLTPEPWPDPHPRLQIHVHPAPADWLPP